MRKILILLLCVLIIACVPPEDQTTSVDDAIIDILENPESTKNTKETSSELTHEICDQAGGNWNECGSPCAGTGAEMCIQSCDAQCQCGGIAGFSCPEGYSCRLSGKVADEIGKCIQDSSHEREGEQ
tara:strand:+ start:6315 stop:6695 length:381 start_codon:yes stop_codon:yes gene_type:complete